MTPQDQDARQLQELLGAFHTGHIDRKSVHSAVIDVILARMGCQRVSMWKFEGSAGRLNLLCFASKTAGGEVDSSERRLAQSEYREYFNALIERGTYISSDAMNDPALEAMREAYLVPNNVRSLLDAAFMLNGRAYGMVCCEETGGVRDWRAGEVMALRAIVTRLALLMSGQPDSVLWVTPSLPAKALPHAASPPAPGDKRAANGKG